jgi:hypothetical protein
VGGRQSGVSLPKGRRLSSRSLSRRHLGLIAPQRQRRHRVRGRRSRRGGALVSSRGAWTDWIGSRWISPRDHVLGSRSGTRGGRLRPEALPQRAPRACGCRSVLGRLRPGALKPVSALDARSRPLEWRTRPPPDPGGAHAIAISGSSSEEGSESRGAPMAWLTEAEDLGSDGAEPLGTLVGLAHTHGAGRAKDRARAQGRSRPRRSCGGSHGRAARSLAPPLRGRLAPCLCDPSRGDLLDSEAGALRAEHADVDDHDRDAEPDERVGSHEPVR